MRAIAYLRVSSDEQAASGAGLAAQEDAARAHAARLGADVVGPFSDEGISGAAPLDARPGLIDALSQVGAGDVLLVAKRDRLGRDPVIVAMLESAVARQGGRVVSAAGEGTDDDSPTSVLMRRIVDAFAEYERLLIKARTRAALQAKRKRGQRTGGVPFGSTLVDDGCRSKKGKPIALAPSAADARATVEARRLRAEGLTLRQVATELDRLGIATKKGAERWAHASVAKILRLSDSVSPTPASQP